MHLLLSFIYYFLDQLLTPATAQNIISKPTALTRPVSSVIPLVFGTIHTSNTTSTVPFGAKDALPQFTSTAHTAVSWASQTITSNSVSSLDSHKNTGIIFQHKQLFTPSLHRQSPVMSVLPLSTRESSVTSNTATVVPTRPLDCKNSSTSTAIIPDCDKSQRSSAVSVGTNMEPAEPPSKAIGTDTQSEFSNPQKITMDQCIQTDDLEDYIRSQSTKTTSAGTDMNLDSPALVDKSVDNIATSSNSKMPAIISTTTTSTSFTSTSSTSTNSTSTNSTSTNSTSVLISCSPAKTFELASVSTSLSTSASTSPCNISTMSNKKISRFPVGDCDDIVAGSKSCPMDKQLSIEIDDPDDIFHDAPMRISSPVKNGQQDVSSTEPPLLTPPAGSLPIQQGHNGILNIVPSEESLQIANLGK